MADEATDDKELREALHRVKWPIAYGYVKIKVKDGKATLMTVEQTTKLD